MAKKIKEFKRCPRCETKTHIYQDKCPVCGLIYSRLSRASNKEAKKAIKNGQLNKVIHDKTLPKDLNKWKLFFMSLFLGMFGGHYYYVGKYKTGIVFSVSTFMLMVAGALATNDGTVWQRAYFWMWLMILPASGCLVWLAVNWVQILFNNFKVPIALKEDEVVVDKTNTEADSTEVLKIVEEVNKKVKKDEKAAQAKAEKDQKKAEKEKSKQEQPAQEKQEETTEEPKPEPKNNKSKKVNK